jgi:hypothetical protein
MTDKLNVSEAQTGDWLEVSGLPGEPARRGQILEVLGSTGHIHFRVRWDEEHESLFYPSGRTVIAWHGHPNNSQRGTHGAA